MAGGGFKDGIRPAIADDADAITAVHVMSWRESYAGLLPGAVMENIKPDKRRRMWSRLLAEGPPPWIFVQERKDSVVGFVSAAPFENGIAEITCLYVLQKAQRRGIGGRLLNLILRHMLEQEFAEVRLFVLQNGPARRFYERMGGRHTSDTATDIGGHNIPVAEYRWTLKPEANGSPR